MLRITQDPGPVATPFHVETSRGLRLASFKTRKIAEAYCRSALLDIAMDLQLTEISDRRSATEEETLP